MVVAFAIVAFAVAACSDSTGPRSSVTVNVTVRDLHAPVLGTIEDTIPSVSCSADMFAIARGTGQVTWSYADVRWYGGVGQSELFDSASFTAANIQSAWGEPTIAAGQSQTMTWNLWATMPFKAVVRYHYSQQGGGQDTTSATIDCGPEVPAGTPAPSVTDLSVQSRADVVEPGDTVDVTYSASSPVGVWTSVVQLSGPCDVRRIIPDSLKTSVTRTVHIALPRTCLLGRSISAAVGAWDGALQGGARVVDTQISLLDVTPPTIHPEYLPNGSGSWSPTFSGTYFTGDTVYVIPSAIDNHALRSFVWEFQPAGVKDSVTTTNWYLYDEIRIPIPSSVTGPQQLRFYAHDAVGLTSDTIAAPKDSSFNVGGTLQLPVQSTTASGEIRDVAIDTRRGLIYLLQSNNRRVVSLSLPSLAVARVDSFPAMPDRFDLTPNGDSLIVLLARMGALGIVDLTQSSHPQSIIPLTGFDTSALGFTPPGMGVTANGTVFVALPSATANMSQLLEVNLETGTQRIRTDAGDGGIIGSGNMVGSLDHSVVLLTGGPTYYQRYESGTDSFGPRESLDGRGYIALDATGDRVAIGRDVYDGSLNFLRTVDSPIGPCCVSGTAISPAGDVVYQAWWPYVVRSRVFDGAILDRIRNPIQPSYLRVSADGKLLITVESDYLTVSTTKISVITLP